MGKGFLVWGKFCWAIAGSEGSDRVGALTWQTAWANPAKVWNLFLSELGVGDFKEREWESVEVWIGLLCGMNQEP